MFRPWSAYDGAVIRLKQRKGRRRGKKNSAAIVVIPLAGPLKAALDAELAARKAAKISPLRLEDEMICLNSEGEPWGEGRAGYNGFISSFKKAKVEAGITGINFSDLRGTAVTRLALAGCTVPEICAITGHSHDEATPSCRRTTSNRPADRLECHPEAGGIHGRNRNRHRNRTLCSTERNGKNAVKSIGWGAWIRTKINGVRVRFLYLQNQDDMSSTKCLTRTRFIGEFPLLSNEDNGAGPAVAG
jgi:hypothetical protein